MEDSVAYLTGWFLESGMALATGFGVAGLPFSEIQAWAALRGLELLPYEAAGLHSMSQAYATEITAEATKASPPWLPDDTDYYKVLNSKIAAGFNTMVKGEASG